MVEYLYIDLQYLFFSVQSFFHNNHPYYVLICSSWKIRGSGSLSVSLHEEKWICSVQQQIFTIETNCKCNVKVRYSTDERLQFPQL